MQPVLIMIKEYLELGQIVSTHGVKGEMRLNPWCDSPEFVKQIKTVYFDINGKKSAAVDSARPHGNIVILKLHGVDTIEQAQGYRNTVLYIRRADAQLPENTWFINDLLGCAVRQFDSDRVYGIITDIQKYPANDVWTVRSKNGKETLVPAVKDVIISADIENETVYINALKGLFDGEESVREDEN